MFVKELSLHDLVVMDPETIALLLLLLIRGGSRHVERLMVLHAHLALATARENVVPLQDYFTSSILSVIIFRSNLVLERVIDLALRRHHSCTVFAVSAHHLALLLSLLFSHEVTFRFRDIIECFL